MEEKNNKQKASQEVTESDKGVQSGNPWDLFWFGPRRPSLKQENPEISTKQIKEEKAKNIDNDEKPRFSWI